MANFYFPQKTNIFTIPLIIYPCMGLEKAYDRKEKGSIEKHLNNLYAKNEKMLKKGQYHIIILWEEKGDKMSDVWIFDLPESEEAGPVVYVNNFRDFERETSGGVSAGDGLVVLGREEEQRRKMGTVEKYINGPRPELPKEIQPNEEFYL